MLLEYLQGDYRGDGPSRPPASGIPRLTALNLEISGPNPIQLPQRQFNCLNGVHSTSYMEGAVIEAKVREMFPNFSVRFGFLNSLDLHQLFCWCKSNMREGRGKGTGLGS